jgi:hypothetical protein
MSEDIFMNKIISDGTNVFEIVDKIPAGFSVWNIGDCMIPGYVPFCDDLHLGALKAIYLPEQDVRLLRDVAHFGIVSKVTAEEALACFPVGAAIDRKRVEKALDVFKMISE